MVYISKFPARNAFAEWLGTGRKNAFQAINATLSVEFLQRQLGLELGQFFEYDNAIYRAVRVRSAITAKGYQVKTYMNAAGRTGTASASSTKAKLVSADTFVKGDLVGGAVWFPSGTDGGLRRILGNTDESGASTVTVAKRVPSLQLAATSAADAFTAAPDGTSTYNVHCGWEVEQTGAATDIVTGVALGAVTDGGLTIILVESEYAEVYCAGNTDALTAGGIVVPSGTAGVAKGPTTAGLTAAEAARWFAQAYDAYSGTGAARVCRLTTMKHQVGGQRVMYLN